MDNELPELELTTSYDHSPLAPEVLSLFDEWEEEGRLGFTALPGDMELLKLSLDLAKSLGRIASHMAVAGIGGSSLGLRALLGAFPAKAAEGSGVTVLDSPDSGMLGRLMRDLDPESSLLTVITKSGGTAETMAIFLSLYRWISSASGGQDRITAVTDPEKGDLRRLVSDLGLHSLPVPPNVGGRFSVMSPVGLFPAAFAGIDVKALLEGAGRILREFRRNGADSLAARTAAAFLSNFSTHPVHAFFCYDDRLYATGLWFAQLWAESLGKKLDLSGDVVHTGQTPLACRGPADQHSLVQLFMEGPMDKTVTIVTTPASGEGPVIPPGFFEYPSMDYLKGLSPDRLRVEEAAATGRALEERGLPVSYLKLGAMDEQSLGELMMTLEIATVLAGLSLGIDPLDQPGVERGKVLTYRALGRPGYVD